MSADQLGPAQQAALRAALTGATTVADTDHALDPATLEHAEYVLIHLRRRRGEPTAVLAGSDWLLGPPTANTRVHPCPLCGLPAIHADRYPRSVCDNSTAHAADSEGRLIVGYNTHFSGGFEARHRTDDGSEGDVCAEVTAAGRCWVDARECSIGEARFGGTVVQAL